MNTFLSSAVVVGGGSAWAGEARDFPIPDPTPGGLGLVPHALIAGAWVRRLEVRGVGEGGSPAEIPPAGDGWLRRSQAGLQEFPPSLSLSIQGRNLHLECAALAEYFYRNINDMIDLWTFVQSL